MIEGDLLEIIQRRLPKVSRKDTLLGMGDDAAILKLGKDRLLATVDTLAEGVHFNFSYTTPREVGIKALEVNLSDIAAMGGTPRWALVSLGVPSKLSNRIIERIVSELYRGISKSSAEAAVDVVGGNLFKSASGWVIDINLLGTAQRPLLRKGARPGDLLCVSGNLGDAAAGLAVLKKWGRNARARKNLSTCIRHQVAPKAERELGEALGKISAITACMDISDGLALDVYRLATASKVGAIIDSAKVPISTAARRAASLLRQSPLNWALFGGEDYRLLFTVRRSHATETLRSLENRGFSCKSIGEITRSRGIRIREKEALKKLPQRGWDHLATVSRVE